MSIEQPEQNERKQSTEKKIEDTINKLIELKEKVDSGELPEHYWHVLGTTLDILKSDLKKDLTPYF